MLCPPTHTSEIRGRPLVFQLRAAPVVSNSARQDIPYPLLEPRQNVIFSHFTPSPQVRQLTGLLHMARDFPVPSCHFRDSARHWFCQEPNRVK